MNNKYTTATCTSPKSCIVRNFEATFTWKSEVQLLRLKKCHCFVGLFFLLTPSYGPSYAPEFPVWIRPQPDTQEERLVCPCQVSLQMWQETQSKGTWKKHQNKEQKPRLSYRLEITPLKLTAKVEIADLL